MVTYRLADSMPAAKLALWKESLKHKNDPELWKKVEAFLDQGYGACPLKDPFTARIVEDAFLHFDGERYRLLAWVVMPNHVHVLVETFDSYPLATIIHSWKSYTAQRINKFLNQTG